MTPGTAVTLGAGTAMVYPTLLAAAADLAVPQYGRGPSRSTASGATAASWSARSLAAWWSHDGLGATLVLAASATALSGIFAFAIRDRAPIVLQSRMTT